MNSAQTLPSHTCTPRHLGVEQCGVVSNGACGRLYDTAGRSRCTWEGCPCVFKASRIKKGRGWVVGGAIHLPGRLRRVLSQTPDESNGRGGRWYDRRGLGPPAAPGRGKWVLGGNFGSGTSERMIASCSIRSRCKRCTVSILL
jgi:hypothetical protein